MLDAKDRFVIVCLYVDSSIIRDLDFFLVDYDGRG